MMIRSERFHENGGFDEDFFAHMEEIDLCWKLQRSGNKVYYSGKSKVYHLGAGTLGYRHPRKTYLNFRNGLSLIFKHLDTSELIFKLPLRLVLDWIAAVLFLIKGEGGSFVSVFRAHIAFLREVPKLKRKRALIRKTHPVYPREQIHQGLIIHDYYIRKRRTFPLQ
jgi:GT2 family glycosyltransferase